MHPPVCEVLPKIQPLSFDPVVEDYADYTPDELGRLEADMSAHGQRVPGAVWNGRIVDGRHRYLTCIKLDIVFRYIDVTEEFPNEAAMRSFVASLNQQRRSRTAPLTNAEKQARTEAALKADPARSNVAIAKEAGVTDKKVARIRAEMERGSEIPNPPPHERKSRTGNIGEGAHRSQKQGRPNDSGSDISEPSDNQLRDAEFVAQVAELRDVSDVKSINDPSIVLEKGTEAEIEAVESRAMTISQSEAAEAPATSIVKESGANDTPNAEPSASEITNGSAKQDIASTDAVPPASAKPQSEAPRGLTEPPKLLTLADLFKLKTDAEIVAELQEIQFERFLGVMPAGWRVELFGRAERNLERRAKKEKSPKALATAATVTAQLRKLLAQEERPDLGTAKGQKTALEILGLLTSIKYELRSAGVRRHRLKVEIEESDVVQSAA
jgi:hypothetical protein